jgi:hypothetical protein
MIRPGGCPSFAAAYLGRNRGVKPHNSFCNINQRRRVPHISLVFREMWAATSLDVMSVEADHPGFVAKEMLGGESYSDLRVTDGSTCAARHAGTQHAMPDTPASNAITER